MPRTATVNNNTVFEIFPWSSNLETGIALIDTQHRKLVELLNRLAEQHIRGASAEEIGAILGELADYADYHFRSEEAIWAEAFADDARYREHVHTHEAFFARIRELQCGDQPFTTILEELFSFLTQWLAYHILDNDKRMAKAVIACGEGCSVAEAHRRADEEMSGATALLIHTVLSMYERLSSQALDLMREKHARLRTEAALSLSEARWKFLLEGSGEGLWEWNAAPASAHADLLQHLNEPGGRLHPDDLARVRAALAEALSAPSDTFSCQYRLLGENGATRWMRLRGKVIERCADGLATRLIGTRQDVTESELASHIVRFGHEMLFIADAGNRVIAVNPAFSALTGYPASACIGCDAGTLFADDWPAERHADIASALQHRGRWEGEVRYRRRDADPCTVFLTILRSDTADGELGQYVAIGYDITAYRASEAALRNVLDAVQAGTWQWQLDTATLQVDSHWQTILGRPADAATLPANAREALLHPDDRARSAALLAAHCRGEQARYECELRMHREGMGWIWVREQGRVSERDANGRAVRVAGILLDINEHKTHQQQLAFVAGHDPLTGLPNRSLLTERLEAQMATARDQRSMLALAYVDLDGFAAINARHGRSAGDQLLKVVTTRLRQRLGERAELARIGGDEFAVVLDGLACASDCRAPVHSLLDALAAPVTLGDLAVTLSGSIGVSLYPQDSAVDAEQLLRQADQAMYRAKLEGKNRFHLFDPEHDQSLRGQLASIEEIRRALARREFVLHFQPKVNMRSGTVLGFEALIRWQHPERGLLAPALFIPQIEAHPLSIAVGDWVLDAALTQLAGWRAAGLHTTVSVNIGSAQLQDPAFFTRLQKLLATHPQVDAAQLQLEILETGALEDIRHVCELIARCRTLGVSFALDDFGTGYSSLTYLKRLDADTIKIDQSFVRDMLDDAEHVAIIDSILGLARTFGRQPLAEGVETAEHARRLLDIGCDCGQGYGIARPMAAAYVGDWLAQWQRSRPDFIQG